MKTLILLLFSLVFCCSSSNAQELSKAERLTDDEAREGFPTWSPDGKSIIYQFSNPTDTSGNNGLWKIALAGTGAKQIFSGIAEHPRWSPDGRYVVFDADTGNNIKMIPAEGGQAISFLPDSVGIFRGGLPCWSPNATQIAFLEGNTGSLCTYDFRAEQLKRIFHRDGMLPLPGGWTSDGNYILVALMDRASRKSTIWKITPDGKGKEQLFGHHEYFYRHLALSPDGSLLAYAAMIEDYLALYIMSVEDEISIPLVVVQKGHVEAPAWSPDGRKLAFTKSIGWNADVWVMDVNAEQIKKRIRQLNNQ